MLCDVALHVLGSMSKSEIVETYEGKPIESEDSENTNDLESKLQEKYFFKIELCLSSFIQSVRSKSSGFYYFDSYDEPSISGGEFPPEV
jgi:hypothetical protein